MNLNELKLIETQARAIAKIEARKILRRYRNGAVVAFLLLAFGVGYAVHLTSAKSYEARGVVCRIIKQGDLQTYEYARDGLINQTQLRRALQASVVYRKQLSPAKGCDTNFTQPPKGRGTATLASP